MLFPAPSRLFLLGAACVLAASAQEEIVFRSETALMEVEVRVTGRGGEPVRDLSPQDFRLYENGDLQDIRAFEHIDFFGTRDDDRPENRPAPSADDRTFAEGDATLDQLRRSKFIYIATRGRPDQASAIADAVTEFINEQLQPGVLISIEGSPFTSSPERLAEVLEEISAGGWSGQSGFVDRLGVAMEQEIDYDDQFNSALDELNEEFEDDQESVVNMEAFYSDLMLYRYINLVQSLSVYPGKKAVVLFSGGMRIEEENLDLLNRFAAEAMRARVSFYTVDARRLTASAPGGDATEQVDATSLFGDVLNNGFQNRQDAFQDSQDGLATIAKESGGRAIFNTNDLGDIFDAVIEDTSEYYVLGYYPANTERRGRFRKIRVEVDRRGVKLDYLRGYYEDESFERMSKSEKRLQLNQALQFDTPYTDLPLTAGFELFRGPDGMPTLAYSVGIHPNDLPSVDKKKGVELAFTVAARAIPAEGNRNGALDEKTLEMRLDPASFERMQSTAEARIHYSSQMRLPQGEYNWKVVIRDEMTGKLGSYKTRLRVPDFEEIPSSSLLVTGRVEELVPPKKKPKDPAPSLRPLDVGRVRFLPDSAHVYRQGDPIFILYDLYNLPADTLAQPPGARLALFRDRQRIQELPVAAYEATPRSDAHQLRYKVRLDSARLLAGDYTLVAMIPAEEGSPSPVIHRRFRITPASNARP